MVGRLWAEYLTFIATVVFVPYESYELTRSISALKILAMVINVVIVVYLLGAKRLLGLRGGGKAERAEYAAGGRAARPVRSRQADPRSGAARVRGGPAGGPVEPGAGQPGAARRVPR